jgi:hypothetical protein
MPRATMKNLVSKFVNRWPAALVILGVALTVAWVALLVGVPLYLLKAI